MKLCMITFRSVTPAQRGEQALNRAGVRCRLQRTPRYMEAQGCGYGLQVYCSDLERAVGLLRGAGIPFRKVYDGVGQELRI